MRKVQTDNAKRTIPKVETMTTKFRSRAAWMFVVPAIFTAACGVALASGEGEKPEDVLKNQGLKKSGSTYILPLEAEAQKKLNEARLASKQLNYALAQQDAVDQGAHGRKALVQELTQERIALNQQMQSVDQVLNAAGGPNGNIGIDQRNFLVNQHNQLVAELNIVSDRLNLLRAHDDPQWAQKLNCASRTSAASVSSGRPRPSPDRRQDDRPVCRARRKRRDQRGPGGTQRPDKIVCQTGSFARV